MSRRRDRRVLPVLSLFAFSCVSAANPTPALAQSGGWEIEVHGGGAFASNLSGGTTTLPGSTALATPIPQFPSRRHSTWFAGDGAALANDVAGRFAVGTPNQIDSRITPLDQVLGRPFAERANGGGIGFRVSRTLSPRLAAELNFDYATASLSVPSAVASGVRTTASSFEATFGEYLAPFLGPAGVTTFAAATATVDDDGGRGQIAATGAVRFALARSGSVRPYATAGAGVVSDGNNAPSAQLEGQYAMRFQGTPIFDETDRVTLTYSADRRTFVGVFGGGATIDLSPRAGVRVDARVHVGSRRVRTLLDATPSVRVAQPPFADVAMTLTNPSIVFSNNPALFNFASSLSGPALNDAVVYDVSGTVTQVLVSVGYFWRF